MNYLKIAEDQNISELQKQQKKTRATKIQEMYMESPKKAMKYYIDRHPTPACQIPIKEITKTLGQRWNKMTTFRPPGNESPWKSEYKLEKEDQDRILSRIQDKELFKEIIRKRDPQSANGPDGIGYLPLQLRIDLSAKYMAIISKLMMKQSLYTKKTIQMK